MGRLFTAASLDHASIVNPVLTVKPMTLACWYKPTNLPAVQSSLVVLQSNTTANRQFQVAVSSAGVVQAIERGNIAAQSLTTAVVTAGAWVHCCATFASGTSGQRIAYANGVGATASTTSVTAPTPERLDVGGYFGTTIGTFISAADGIIAFPAIWDVPLIAAEVLALAKGAPPLSIRPGRLKFYAPLFGGVSPEPDYTNGQRALTVTGASLAAGPPTAMPFLA